MKSIARAILIGGFIVAAQGAVADGLAFPSSGDDDTADHVPVQSTYADRHASDPARSTSSAFPASGDDDMASHVPVRSTYADRHANDPVRRTGSTFPSGG